MGEYFFLSPLSLVKSGGEKRNEGVYSFELVWINEFLKLAPVYSSLCASRFQIAFIPIQHCSAHKARNIASYILRVCFLA